MPHCHWRIDITADAALVEPPPLQAVVAASRAAQLPVRSPDPNGASGRADYSGDFDPELRLEDFTHEALVVALDEFALQSHLLLRSLLVSVASRLGADHAAAIVPRLVAGWCGLTAQRLRDGLQLEPTVKGLATMLTLHPMFAPRSYVASSVEVDGDAVRLAFRDCPALQEGDSFTWVTGLGASSDAALDQVVAAFHPQTRCSPVTPSDGERFAYEVRIDPDAEPLPEAPELAIAKISTGARFRFKS
jgi:hypothetical protein